MKNSARLGLGLTAVTLLGAAHSQTVPSLGPVDFPGNKYQLRIDDLRSADVQAVVVPVGAWSKAAVVDIQRQGRLLARHQFKVISGDLAGRSVNILVPGADTGRSPSLSLSLDPKGTYLLLANGSKSGLLEFPYYGYKSLPRPTGFQVAASQADLSGIAIFRVSDSHWTETPDRAKRFLEVLTRPGEALSHWELVRRFSLLVSLLQAPYLKPSPGDLSDIEWCKTILVERMIRFGDTLPAVERAAFYGIPVAWRIPNSREPFLGAVQAAAKADPNAFNDEDGDRLFRVAGLVGWTEEDTPNRNTALGNALASILSISRNPVLTSHCISDYPLGRVSESAERAVFTHLEDSDARVRLAVLSRLASITGRRDLTPKQGDPKQQEDLVATWKATGFPKG